MGLLERPSPTPFAMLLERLDHHNTPKALLIAPSRKPTSFQKLLQNRRRVILVASLVAIISVVTAATLWHYNQRKAPQSEVPTQIHIALGNPEGTAMVISWVTPNVRTGKVLLRVLGSNFTTIFNQTEDARQYSYEYYYQSGTYVSGFTHHVKLTNLMPLTTYQYSCGVDGAMSGNFTFKTWGSHPLSNPFTFILMGDLGQTADSKTTRDHAIASGFGYYPTILVGDLSYADSAMNPKEWPFPCDQARWDSWGELIQPLAASSPLMVLPGNHETEYNPEVASQVPFIAYQTRFRMPSVESGATEGNLYYSFDTPFAHVIMLNSYDGPTFSGPYNSSTLQYQWLARDLAKVDRNRTAWVIVAMHSPWYNSNTAHHDEDQEVYMRRAMEPLLHQYGVDLVFAGHVHAYERMFPVYDNQTLPGAATYINIGDGGNREGPANDYYPQPSWSAFRESQFGFGLLKLYNGTHAHWTWHRNKDKVTTVGDEVWLVKNWWLQGNGAKENIVTGVTAFSGKSEQ